MTATSIRSLLAPGACALTLAFVLAGCASTTAPENTAYDFGPAAPVAQPAAQAASSQVPALVVMDFTGPSALDNEDMYYRLNYADALQARTYANSRWTSSPLQMITQRVKTRLAQSGIKILSATDAATGIPLLRVEVEDFVHAFSGVNESAGRLTLRASLFNDHRLLDQRSFSHSVPAPSANAAGGARALAAGTDAVAADILAWLATVDTSKR